MSASTILVLLAERLGAEECLKAAWAAAGALSEPRIAALHVRVDPLSTILPTEEVLPGTQQRHMQLAAAEEGEALRAIYERWRRDVGGAFDGWEDVAGVETSEVARHGAGAALIVMAAPTQTSGGRSREAFHAAMFETHRPVLVVPRGYEARGVRRICVAWKESDVTINAIRAAMPWLRHADEVRVVHVGDSSPHHIENAGSLLAKHGVRTTMHLVSANGMSDGQRLLSEAHGADWVVMGAFAHGRLMEWILGGVTQAVLERARIPVFMVHDSSRSGPG